MNAVWWKIEQTLCFPALCQPHYRCKKIRTRSIIAFEYMYFFRISKIMMINFVIFFIFFASLMINGSVGNMLENNETFPWQFPVAQGILIKDNVLFNERSKTQRYWHLWLTTILNSNSYQHCRLLADKSQTLQNQIGKSKAMSHHDGEIQYWQRELLFP